MTDKHQHSEMFRYTWDEIIFCEMGVQVTPWTVHGQPIPVTAQQRLQGDPGTGGDGAEIRRGCDVPTQAWAHSPSALCAVGSSAQEGNHSIGKALEEVTECHELLALCQELL